MKCSAREARGRRFFRQQSWLGVHRATFSRGRKMSTDDSPEKLHEDGTVETPEWHRARAKRLRANGFTKMAEQHEQVAQMIERRRQQAK
jgi:hypothetical protein